MKKLVMTLTVLMLSGLFANTFAQEKNFVISTDNPHRIQIAIKSANALVEKYRKSIGEIQIVLYGKAVDELDNPETTATWLELRQHKSIHFSACNVSITHRNVDKTKIPKTFSVVSNAFVYILSLKEQGYIGLDV